MNPNPFALSMTRMYVPAHMAATVSVGGFQVEADEERGIEVPNAHVSALQSHGLTLEKPKADAPVDAKKK